jgi:hypothetical protein
MLDEAQNPELDPAAAEAEEWLARVIVGLPNS